MTKIYSQKTTLQELENLQELVDKYKDLNFYKCHGCGEEPESLLLYVADEDFKKKIHLDEDGKAYIFPFFICRGCTDPEKIGGILAELVKAHNIPEETN